MKLVNNFKIKLIKNKLEILVFIIFVLSMAMGTIVYFLPIEKGDSILYLLSSISQGLAAIFALVFAITIFGAQMMRKFTAMDKMIDKWTKMLMIIFAIGIILPLMQLETNYDFLNDLFHLNLDKTENLSLAIDLSIATFCVLVIIPYLMRVNRIMKYEGGISKLSEELAEAIDSNHKATASNRINELVELGENGAEDMMEFETINIIEKLEGMGEKVIDKGWEDIASHTIIGLEVIGLRSAKRKLDGRQEGKIEVLSATQDVMKAIKEIGIKATDKKLGKYDGSSMAQHAIHGLKRIGISAIDNDLCDETVFTSSRYLFELCQFFRKNGNDIVLTHTIDDLVESTEDIANRAYEKDRTKFKNTSELSLLYLWILCVFAKNYLPQFAEKKALQFKKSNKQVIRDLFGSENIRHKAMECFPELNDELKAFEEFYDNLDDISFKSG